MSERPWMKFYPSDWRADPALRTCSIGARGLWMEMICVMHEAEPRGSLRVNGVALQAKQIASLAGIKQRECEKYLEELENSGVFSRENDGEIFSRRMKRETAKDERARNNGLAGGNPDIRRGTVPKDQRVRPYKRTDAPEKTKRIFNKTNGLCNWCGVGLIFEPTGDDPRNFHVDHVVAICDGGTNDEANLVPSCAACNHKRARDPNPTLTLEFSDSNPQKLEARVHKQKGDRSLRSLDDWPKDAFDQFWRRYPHKVGKAAALKAFAAAKRTATPWARVLFALDRYIAEKPPDRPWCNPSTWLNQGRWDDEPARASTGPPGRQPSLSFREIADQLRGDDHEEPATEPAVLDAGFDFDRGGGLR